ncbi:MAG: PDGLE domain-containing protein [Candidatus Omnitrophica bacterium]|nr:PDGLE domain-containing protein [Candidatus Omnitrophota bacterium]
MDKKEIIFGLMAAIFLAMVFSPFASPWPDGLEKVAEDKGFLEKGEIDPVLPSPIPDYAWPALKSEKLATSVAGAAGTLLVFGMGYGLAALIRRHGIQ